LFFRPAWPYAACSPGLSAKLASEVNGLKCDFIAITDWQLIHCNDIIDEADVEDFSENGYAVAGLKPPIDISDDAKLGQVFDLS